MQLEHAFSVCSFNHLHFLAEELQLVANDTAASNLLISHSSCANSVKLQLMLMANELQLLAADIAASSFHTAPPCQLCNFSAQLLLMACDLFFKPYNLGRMAYDLCFMINDHQLVSYDIAASTSTFSHSSCVTSLCDVSCCQVIFNSWHTTIDL